MVRWAYDHACLHTCIYGGTTDGDRLVKAAQTVTILSMLATPWSSVCFTSATGRTLCRMVYLVFKRPITRSTWIRTLAKRCEYSTSSWLSWDFPLVKDGIANLVPCTAKSSLIVNPQSASTVSPCSRRFKKPHFWVRCLSDTLPPQHKDKYEIIPQGVIPISSFTVLWCL